jgi:hypothetical protein
MQFFSIYSYIFSIYYVYFFYYFAPPQRAAAALCRLARLARSVSAYFFHKKDIATHQALKAGVGDLGQRAARPQRTQ